MRHIFFTTCRSDRKQIIALNLLVAVAIGFFSCGQAVTVKEDIQVSREPYPVVLPDFPAIGTTIQGDFNGDGKLDVAMVKRIKQGQGNPVEGGSPDEYEIHFSDGSLLSLPIGCCEPSLINEGDLNDDGADDLSLFQAPMNGCVYSMTTYSFTDNSWHPIVPTFLIPTGCEVMREDDLQKRVVKEADGVYYYDTDLNDESGALVRKRVLVKRK